MSKQQFSVLVISPWRSATGEEGTRFIKVGVAYERDVGGFTCYLYDNVSVSGKLLIAPDLDNETKPSKKIPTAHRPYPDNDEPF